MSAGVDAARSPQPSAQPGILRARLTKFACAMPALRGPKHAPRQDAQRDSLQAVRRGRAPHRLDRAVPCARLRAQGLQQFFENDVPHVAPIHVVHQPCMIGPSRRVGRRGDGALLLGPSRPRSRMAPVACKMRLQHVRRPVQIELGQDYLVLERRAKCRLETAEADQLVPPHGNVADAGAVEGYGQREQQAVRRPKQVVVRARERPDIVLVRAQCAGLPAVPVHQLALHHVDAGHAIENLDMPPQPVRKVGVVSVQECDIPAAGGAESEISRCAHPAILASGMA